MENTPFIEKAYIYGDQNQRGRERNVHYDYMHIRMKPQSAKHAQVSVGAKPKPIYVIVTIFENNILKVFDLPAKV